ncbi:MAG: hypothetical protein R3185_00840, partial [Candidatus Thermoplasmatota archaeon]|nr:hypothetical protein [Candidatus Thermoplasmatota archaeon]
MVPRARTFLLLAITASLALAGCTSDTPGTAGTEQPTPDDGGTDPGPAPAQGTDEATPTRMLPALAECGDTITVTYTFTPPAGTEAWLLEEYQPEGWEAKDPTGALAPEPGKTVKFAGAGDTPVELTYKVTIPADFEGTAAFDGEYRYNPSMDTRAATTGQ